MSHLPAQKMLFMDFSQLIIPGRKTLLPDAKDAITLDSEVPELSGFKLNSFYSSEKRLFEFGKIPVKRGKK